MINFDLNNKTILITGLIIVSIVGLVFKNDYIVTTVIGGLLGYLSKDLIIPDNSDNGVDDDTA